METKSSKDGQAYKMDGKSKEVAEDFSQKTNETINTGAKAVEKGLKDVNENIMELYNKQLQFITGFYNNLLNPVNNKDWSIGQGFGNSFSNNDLTKLFSNPFSGVGSAFSNPFLSSFDQVFKQIIGSNNNLFSAFNGQSKINTIDWSAVSKKIQEAVANRLEVSKNIFNSLSEAHNKKVNFLLETKKEEIEEISNQFSLLIKQNQKFFADLVETFQAPLNEEDNNNNKESTFNSNKKRFNSPVN